MANTLGKIVGGAVVVAAVVGMKMHNKGATEREARETLRNLCAGEAACLEAVETHFDACFESAYSMGSRRRSASFDGQEMVQCINTKSGVEHFGWDPTAK
jgi:hypothetical protein